jgi:hypothetical protein
MYSYFLLNIYRSVHRAEELEAMSRCKGSEGQTQKLITGSMVHLWYGTSMKIFYSFVTMQYSHAEYSHWGQDSRFKKERKHEPYSEPTRGKLISSFIY